MTKIILSLVILFAFGCNEVQYVDTTPPAIPRGIDALSLENAVEITWIPNTEPDLRGYNVWVSDRYDGRYQFLASVHEPIYLDRTARNGRTSYYAVSALDFDGNESSLSSDVASATPRPEGFGVRLTDYRSAPSLAGYDFSTYSIGPFDDAFTDFFFERFNDRFSLNVWDDTDIQDMGYTTSLDEIRKAPLSGWSPSGSVEAIPGHTYVIWTWDNHFAKVRIRMLNPVVYYLIGHIRLPKETQH
ncbi:MAG TPA: hypothetical protein VNN76_00175 [Bacteroidota bacterium]|nr:hypothetical protein [Bacteroidota bacterium]